MKFKKKRARHMNNPKENINPASEEQKSEMNPIEDAEILDNVEDAHDEAETGVDDETAEGEADLVNTLQEDLNAANAALEKEKKEYLFLMAEFDNFRKRTVKERAELVKNAAESTMKNLLPIVDDMERGLEATKNATDPEAIREGMELIYQKLVKLLEQNGVKAIDSTGKAFDPDTQEAIAMVPVTDEAQKGQVIDTPVKGYMINDKVLRHAKVAVGQ